MSIRNSKPWQDLSNHKKTIDRLSAKELFTDKQRFSKFSFELNNILFDFSKQRINEDTISLLSLLLQECDYKNKIQAMFNGEKINHTENRKAFHVGLRAENKGAQVTETLLQIESLVDELHNGTKVGATNKSITDIISVGIGGSDLGPRMVCQALENYKQSKVKIHFISNVDHNSLHKILSSIDPERTIAIINSKSFTTIETLTIGSIIKAWFKEKIQINSEYQKHLLAVTANLNKALEFGVAKENVFQLWDWVGGRFSVWSAVGLPIAISLGMQQFYEFLNGARAVDQHFLEAPIANNIPILMALIGIWNNNFLNHSTLAVMPYLDCLELLPAYLQQLEMESNGKSIDINGDKIDYNTAPIIWGGTGCNNQHAYMQLLHQGSITVPADFIVSVNSTNNNSQNNELNKLLFASCIGQSQALMYGNKNNISNPIEKLCSGNKPNTIVAFPKLTPSILGSLIAIYEHKVFIQGIVWQIQSFDQWGVELGKKIIKDILPLTSINTVSEDHNSELDTSTLGLLEYYKKHSL